MARQVIQRGNAPNDHANAESQYSAFGKINDMTLDLYSLQSRIVNAADVRFASQPTTELKIQAAITQAALELATAVFVPAFMMPFDATLITFNPAIRMVREGGDFSEWDIRAYGASCDGTTNDLPAWTAAIAGATANAGIVRHSGGVSGIDCTSSGIVYPASSVTAIHGTGMTTSSVKRIAGSNPVFSATHTHLVSEWNCELRDILIDGGGTSGTVTSFSRTTRLIWQNVLLTNGTGTLVSLISCYDPRFDNIFLSDRNGSYGVVASAFVIDTVASPANEQADHGTFVGIHIEGGFGAGAIPFQLVGNATNVVRFLRFFGLKVHGNPNNGDPAATMISVSGNATDNEFHGVKLAAGNGSPQFVINGHRNVVVGGQANTGAGAKPTAAIQLAGNDNRVLGFNINDTTYSTADFMISGARNRAVGTIYNSSGPVLQNTGTETVFDNRPGSTNRGDTSITITPGVETEEQIFNTPLSVGRTCTIGNGTSGSQRWQGARFRIQRTAAATGAFVLNVRNPSSVVLRTLMPGEWVEVVYDDTNGWIVHAFGTLAHSASGSIVQFFSATPTFDASQASAFQMTLTANVTSVTISSGSLGQRVVLTMIQDGTGGWTVSGWVAAIKQAWSDTGNTLNKRSSIAFVWDGTNWNQDGAQGPYV